MTKAKSIVVIDGVRYRREDAEARGLIEVPDPVQVASIDPDRLAAFEAWVAAGSPAPTAPLDTDRHSSLAAPVVVGGEAEVVEQGAVTLPTQDGPAPAAAAGDQAPPEAEVTTEKPDETPAETPAAESAPLSTESAAPKRASRSK